jgi:hypothetical protein
VAFASANTKKGIENLSENFEIYDKALENGATGTLEFI